MILHPAVIALLLSAVLTAALVAIAAGYGVQVLRHWDLRSGSSQQLALERRTYLISTVLAYVFGFQLLSLFLLIYTADSLHGLFTGAMCAAGTFNANRYGYPLLLTKVATFVFSGLWLIVNHADNQAYDYPLIRKKYAALVILSPVIFGEAALQVLYFAALNPDVITSCCGSLFSSTSASIAADIASLPAAPMRTAFAASLLVVLVTGVIFKRTGKGGGAFSLVAGAFFLTSLASILSFISTAVYELPSHHCPFCILQKDYYSVGYLLYALIFTGAVTGVGVGVLMPFRTMPSLEAVIPSLQQRLAGISILCTFLLGAVTIVILATSNLRQ